MIPEGSRPQTEPPSATFLWISRAAFWVLGVFLGIGGVVYEGISRSAKGSDVADVVRGLGYALRDDLAEENALPNNKIQNLAHDSLCPDGCSQKMEEELAKLVWNPKFASNTTNLHVNTKWEWLAYHPYQTMNVFFVLYADGHTEMVTSDTLQRLRSTR